MCATLPQDLRGYRDRAILLLGFAGGLRRSEISGLDCGPEQTENSGGWIEMMEEGIILSIRGKTGWRSVEIVKRCLQGVRFRAGLASSTALNEADMQRQLGHASVEMTARYQR